MITLLILKEIFSNKKGWLTSQPNVAEKSMMKQVMDT